MKYSKLKYILQTLDRYALQKLDTRFHNNNIVNISFLDKQTVLKSDTIYISVAEDPFTVLDKAIIYPGTVIICCNEKVRIPDGCDINAFIYVVNCEYMIMYNLMNDILSSYRDYHSFITFVQIENLSVEQILRTAEAKYRIHLYFLQSNGVMLAGHDKDDNQKLIDATIRLRNIKDYEESSGIDGNISCRQYSIDERLVVASELSDGSTQLGTLTLVALPSNTDDIQTLALTIARAIVLNHRANAGKTSATDANRFEQFLLSVLSSDHNDLQQLQHLSDNFNFPVKKYWQLLLIKYDGDFNAEQPLSMLSSDLQYAFADMNIAIYRDKIVMLLTYDQDDRMPEQYRSRLETILNSHSAVAAEGLIFSRLSHFKDQLRILSRGLDLCQVLKIRSTSRIFEYRLCKTYFMIDLALSSYQKNYSSFDFTQLIHADIIAVYNYDKANQTNLLEVLYLYLINNQNVNVTASWLYVHRNTVRNRINQIKEFIKSDLDDPGVQFELLNSCFIIRYITRYLNLNIF